MVLYESVHSKVYEPLLMTQLTEYLALLLFNTHNMDEHRSRSMTRKNRASLKKRGNQMVDDSM